MVMGDTSRHAYQCTCDVGEQWDIDFSTVMV